ncbi:MAG: Lipase precursor [Myxococcaceae bacterium]|nr:Lipase precursor [Myxococcaceae bacterium]
MPDDAALILADLSVPPDLTEDDVPTVDVARVTPLDAGTLPEAGTVERGPFPVVFVHGFAGFQGIGALSYFYRVADDLRRRGEVVYTPELPPFAPPATRAPVLAAAILRALAETGKSKVVLIAHSQGGLDARYLISTLAMGDRVAALITVATPHRGTRLGDAFAGLIPGVNLGLLDAAATAIGAVYNGAPGRAEVRGTLAALSERDAARFNAGNPDDPRVRYYSVAGRSNRRDGRAVCGDAMVANAPTLVDAPFLPLAPLAGFLEGNDPTRLVNDGLVTVESARWGTFIGCVPADHFDEVGQIAHQGPDRDSTFDHIVLYRELVRRLRDDGL